MLAGWKIVPTEVDSLTIELSEEEEGLEDCPNFMTRRRTTLETVSLNNPKIYHEPEKSLGW
jgi:hypothetical protein